MLTKDDHTFLRNIYKQQKWKAKQSIDGGTQRHKDVYKTMEPPQKLVSHHMSFKKRQQL